MENKKPFISRRKRFLADMGPRSVALIAAAPITFRNADVENDYRQNSDFFYLTGFDEPDSVLLLSTMGPEEKAVLFVRPRDRDRELWEGPRKGCDGAKLDLEVDATHPIEELSEKLPDYLMNVESLYYRFGIDRGFDDLVFQAINRLRKRIREGLSAPRRIVDSSSILHEHRLVKTKHEIASIEAAAAITREAFLRAMEVARPGRFEYKVEAEISRVFRSHGCRHHAFGCIVASGANATFLHYRNNDRLLLGNELLLIDAGVEYGYYASDVTRTFPVGGSFSRAQRALYELVLEAQQAAIESVRPGATLDDIHDKAVTVLTSGLIGLRILKGPLEKAIDEKSYKEFYMHRTSHWLGMDVHDVGDYFIDEKPRLLKEGIVLTVEPGIYIPESAKVARKWRGIGIRVEDDIVVTREGHRNLTSDIPKSVSEIERILAERR
ncbi:MAG: aminopeptidase P N-terminal domain-containing protein [Deltaproteobacteria bacterium]|nr:aminopeptidase P N-terminal domain-containing protein [Deltaproteobacteria bacterium]